MTALDIIKTQMRLIGALASGETPTSAEVTDALAANNRMLGQWSAQNLLINVITNETFTLVADQQQYTMGSGGNFDTARPQSIIKALVRYTTDPVADLPVKIITNDEWERIATKGVLSTLPTHLYVNYTYPLATLNFWPIPSAAKALVLDSLKPLTQFVSSSSTFSMPPEYEEAVVYNGAKRLATEFSLQMSPDAQEIAVKSLANIKRINSRAQLMRCEDSVLSRTGYANYITGDID